MLPKGRKKGGGWKSQLLILFSLASGPKSAIEIQRLTKLSKNTVWYNLKILNGIKAIKTEKKGKKVFYLFAERPFLKWLLFHSFIGHKWALKFLKGLKRFLSVLPKAAMPIINMFNSVRKYRIQYEKLRKQKPYLDELDVWHAIGELQEYKYLKLAKKYMRIADAPQLKCDYSWKKLIERRREFLEVCKIINNMEKDIAERFLLNVYYELVKTLFPEIKKLPRMRTITDYERFSFKLAAEFDKMIEQREKLAISDAIEKLKKDVDDIYHFCYALRAA
jgi:DNA-binding transcriptional regulator GbsR (MarR family)